MRKQPLATVVAALLAALLSASGSASLARSESERGFRGVLAVRGDRVVASENPDRLFTPASVTKLVVAAAAMHYLGPEHRVTTRVHARGRLSQGVLEGDLVVVAAGDPTWSERFFAADPRAPLRELARQLKAAGLERVTGDLVLDVHRFPGRGHALSRPSSELAFGFAAPTSALAIDENSVVLEIAPGPRVGAPGSARFLSGGHGLRIEGSTHTVSGERHGKGTVDIQPQWGSQVIRIRGEYPVTEPSYRIDVSLPNADRFVGDVLAEILRRQGLEIAGEVRVSRHSGPSGPVLAEVDSPPLAAWLVPILTDSNNWIAEMLLRVVAAEVTGEGRDDVGLELEQKFLEEQVGLSPNAVVLDDGSGLSPYNLLSPTAVVELLRWAWRQSWRRHFVEALASPGRGTLEIWRGLPSVAAKTGMIRETVALAGYVEPTGVDEPLASEPLIFACFLNHRPGDRGALRSEIARLVRHW